MISGDAIADLRHGNLKRLLFPRSIAIVGASKDPAKAGFNALNTLSGFDGDLFAINPRESEIAGVPCFPDLASLPIPVDLAILAVPAKACPAVVRAAADKGVGGVFIISGGFGETGEEGRALQDELAAICRETGIRLLGPNTSGFLNPRERCAASFVHRCGDFAPGRVAVVAQSGGVNLTVAFQLRALGEGVSLAVGIGNGADVDASDVLEQLLEDEETRAITLHLEGVTEGRRLMQTLRRVTAVKPVCAVIAGRADIGEFAQSHTGNMLGARQRTVAALRQSGVVVVDTLEELAQAASVLAAVRLAPCANPGVALITGQAGPGLLIVDGVKTLGLSVPALADDTAQKLAALLPPMTFVKNPVDTGRPSETFPAVVQAVARDPAVDLVLIWSLVEPAVLDPASALQDVPSPVVFGSAGMPDDIDAQRASLGALGLSFVTSPERLVLAARVLCADAMAQTKRGRAEADVTAGAPMVRIAGNLDESAAKALLAQYGIPVPQRRVCHTHAEAHAALEDVGAPVVVKIVAEGLVHKSDVGGVHLGVRSSADLDRALAAIDAIPAEGGRSYLVERMAAGGLELIIGGTNDPAWGPVLLVGAGGVNAEVLDDSALRIGPISCAEALEMIADLRIAPLIDGFRGSPRLDALAAAKVLVALGRLLSDHPEIAEAEINPFRLYPQGGVALDAVVIAQQSA